MFELTQPTTEALLEDEFLSLQEAFLYLYRQADSPCYLIVRHLEREVFMVLPFERDLSWLRHNHELVGYFKPRPSVPD